MKKRFSLVLPIDFFEKVKIKAEAENRSVTNYIVKVLKKEIEK